jgi:hypothetical protein
MVRQKSENFSYSWRYTRPSKLMDKYVVSLSHLCITEKAGMKYEGVSRNFQTGRLKRELQMV